MRRYTHRLQAFALVPVSVLHISALHAAAFLAGCEDVYQTPSSADTQQSGCG